MGSAVQNRVGIYTGIQMGRDNIDDRACQRASEGFFNLLQLLGSESAFTNDDLMW